MLFSRHLLHPGPLISFPYRSNILFYPYETLGKWTFEIVKTSSRRSMRSHVKYLERVKSALCVGECCVHCSIHTFWTCISLNTSIQNGSYNEIQRRSDIWTGSYVLDARYTFNTIFARGVCVCVAIGNRKSLRVDGLKRACWQMSPARVLMNSRNAGARRRRGREYSAGKSVRTEVSIHPTNVY